MSHVQLVPIDALFDGMVGLTLDYAFNRTVSGDVLRRRRHGRLTWS
jgi:hypothetical protein